ncbi:hypothetical protein [Cyclobacterium plantarum]|uniref:Uncharacterized protein n=1 Tax=Cyclobacterium plantarum TaxID=2716263 RepID=A0ABX0HIQ8_9BACT|nr:hypothetical protein [Cyclobacterium plantarum]NHE59960.1 hypothetical protein [Cyclobacterium plantarum]
MKIDQINEAIKPYYTLLTMIVGIGGVFIGAYALIIKPSDLQVILKKEKIDYPVSINQEFLELNRYVLENCPTDETKLLSVSISNYLLKTKDHWIVKLINKSNKYISGLEVRIPNTKLLTSYGISSNFLLEEEKDKFLEKIDFQDKSGIVYIKPEIEIPSNSNIEIYLWGDFTDFNWGENIHVKYSGGEGKLQREVISTGFKAYITEFYIEIFLVLLIIFLLTYSVGIKLNEANIKKISGISD